MQERCFVRAERIVVWETFDLSDPFTQAAGDLYEQTLAPEERIPWIWIEKAVENRRHRKRNFRQEWNKHLLLAAREADLDAPGRLAGYAYGAYLPGFGGYLCYLGVAEWARRLGIGTRLMEQFFRQMTVDAGELGEPVPFVLWESRRPEPEAGEAAWELWMARVRLFQRVGAWWIEGVDFLTPNFAANDEGEEEAEPVPLQLFLRPMEEPVSALTSERLRQIIAQLQLTVYRREPGDDLYEQTLPPGCQPQLRPAWQVAQKPAATPLAAGKRA